MVLGQMIAVTKEFMAQRTLGVLGLVAAAGLQFWNDVFHDIFKGSRGDVVSQVKAIQIGFILNTNELFGNGCSGTNQYRTKTTDSNPLGKFSHGPFFAVTRGFPESVSSGLDSVGFNVADWSVEIVFGEVCTHPTGHQRQGTFHIGVLCEVAVFFLGLLVVVTGNDGLQTKASDVVRIASSFAQFFTSLGNRLGLKCDRRRIDEGSFGVFRTKASATS